MPPKSTKDKGGGKKGGAAGGADGKDKKAEEAESVLTWDASRCSGMVRLMPERMMTWAKVDAHGWGYVATALAAAQLDGVSKRYFEVNLEEQGWGCMVGLCDASRYFCREGACADSPVGWLMYCNNGKYFHNKECVGESGAIVRAGDTVGVMYQHRPAQRPAHWEPGMGEVSGTEGFLVFFKNGTQLPGGMANVARYATHVEQTALGPVNKTIATPLMLTPVVDFYSAGRLKVLRGTQQDAYVNQITQLTYKM